jgi:hypothetical protein
MSEVNDQQNGPVREIIVKGRQIMITGRLVLGLLVWVTVCLGMWLALFFLDNLLHLPPGLRLAIALGGAGLMTFELWKSLLSRILQLGGLETTALILEREYNVPENMLVNAMYFEARQFDSGEEPFAQRTIQTAVSLMTRADLKKLWEMRRIKRWLVAAVIVMLLWGIYGIGISQGRYAVNALARFIRPLGDVPPAGSVVLKVTPDSDVTIAEGDDLRVLVEVVGKGDDSALLSYPEIAWLEGADSVNPDKGKNKTMTMRAVEHKQGAFDYTFAGVERPFAFRVFAADTYSSSVKVMVNAVPRIKESQFHISPPAYTGGGRVSTLGPPEAVSGLADSQIVVDVKLDKQAEGLRWKALGKTIEFKNVDRIWRAETQLARAGSYQLEVNGPGSDRRIAIASGAVLLQQDAVPEIEFVEANRNYTVNPGERLNLDIAARDDFGIGQVYVTLRQVRADSPAEAIKHWRYEGPPGRKAEVEETLFLPIDSSVFKPGNSYVLQAFCQDFSPMNNTGKSQPVTLQVKSLDELAIAEDDPASDAFAALAKAIAAQQAALGVTKNLLTNLDDVIDEKKRETENIKSLQRHQGEMSKRQERVGTHMTEAWDVSSPPRPRFVSKLIALRDGEHGRAMEKIKAVGAAKADQTQTTGTGPTDKPAIRVVGKPAVSRSLRSVERLQAFLLEQLVALKGVIAMESQAEAEKAKANDYG